MNYYRDQAVILQVFPHREQDVRIVFYTKERGRVDAMARGLKRAQSKQRGHVRPGTLVDVVLAQGKAMEQLAVVKAHPERREEMYERLAVTGAFARLTRELTHPGENDPVIFDLWQEWLTLPVDAQQMWSEERARWLYAVLAARLASHLGYHIDFTVCAECRQSNLLEYEAFVREAGGYICFSCLKKTPVQHHVPGLPQVDDLPKLLRTVHAVSLETFLRLTVSKQLLLQGSYVILASLPVLPLRHFIEPILFLDRKKPTPVQ